MWFPRYNNDTKFDVFFPEAGNWYSIYTNTKYDSEKPKVI